MSDENIHVDIRIDQESRAGQEWVAAIGRDRWIPTPFVELSGGIPEVANVQYASVQPIGRTEAYKTYVGVNNREITLLFHFIADGVGSVQHALTGAPSYNGIAAATRGTAATIENTVISPALWLENLKYPTIPEGTVIGAAWGNCAPPPVYLVVGSLLSMRAIATDVSLRWLGPWYTPDPTGDVFDNATGLLPMAADVQVTFTSVSASPGGVRSPTQYTSRPGM